MDRRRLLRHSPRVRVNKKIFVYKWKEADVNMAQNPKNLLHFFKLIGKLKSTPRTGWVLCGVKNPESIADHMYRMGIMAFLIPESSGLDINRCVKLALIHDIAECIVGDITPHCGVSPEKKHGMENEAISELSKLVGESSVLLSETYKEYAEQKTPEAKIVKELDRLDMVIQAFEYETEGAQSLQEFFDSTRGKFQNPWVLAIIQELYNQRDAHRINRE